MATVYAMTFTVLGLVLMYASLVVWVALILPAPVARARARLETRPVASFFAGVGIFLLTALVFSVWLMMRGQFVILVTESLQRASAAFQFNRFYNDEYILANLVAWPLAAPAMVGWIIGGAAFAQMFAAQARPLMHGDRPLLSLILGALTAGFASFLPAVGWFVFFPVITLMSTGAGLLAVLKPHGHLKAHAGSPAAKSTAGQEQPSYESELASS